MAYTKTNWQDEITPLSAANMNKIEQGIADAHAALDARKLITYTSLADIGLTSASFDGLTTEEQFFDTVIPKMADGSLLILVIEGNNSPINNVGRFLPGTGGSGSINGILEIVKGNNNRTSVTYQFATTSALGGAHATRYEGTYVSGNTSPNRKWSGWAKVWNSATFDPDAKFDKAGGTITGNVIIDNAQLQFRDGTATKRVIETWGGDGSGIGVVFGGAGGTIIAGGEADAFIKANNGPTNEHVYIGADANIYFYSNLQNDWNSRHEMIWRNNGNLEIGGNVVWHAGNNPANKQATFGYQRLQSGVVIQWSYHRPISDGTYSHTFPLTYSSVKAIQVTPIMEEGDIGYVSVSNLTNSGFKVTISGMGMVGYDVLSIGYV